MKLIKLVKARGIGLLELMLSLAIIAILLIMATRYYQSASDSQKVSQAVDMFAALKSAAQNFHNSQSQTGMYPSTVTQLVSAGYLPASYLDSGASGKGSSYSDPWNGAITIGEDTTTPGMVNITMVVPDQQSCSQVVNKLAATISGAAGEVISPASGSSCTKGANSVQVTYAITQ